MEGGALVCVQCIEPFEHGGGALVCVQCIEPFEHGGGAFSASLLSASTAMTLSPASITYVG